MKPVLLIIDVQSTFNPPNWLIQKLEKLLPSVHSIATIELHDESIVPFKSQLNWAPSEFDECPLKVEKVFIKYGYSPTDDLIQYFKGLDTQQVYVCGIQTDTCVLAAGFRLFDAGLFPCLVTDLTVGSSLDRSGNLGIQLWKHHFRSITTSENLSSNTMI
ncbi:cysteine hydrolase family protein [Acinetobacter nosocomialis]|uniref:cysteine hydrolase family protein n=1 Tax=Acinetobacter nosocomialis TaxID=106654 RepID=UPI0023AF6E03|nr:cysteine hydrolase family protein [Acinetobacter nosocomialis]MDE9412799.1 cysteine hydrolase family protein [Acinetobacter nosocomialis]